MTAAEIIPHISQDHRCRHMLTCLCEQSPEPISQTKLMQIGLFSESIQGRLCAYTAFEYWMLQIDAQLRRLGWRIEELGTGYRVVPNGVAS